MDIFCLLGPTASGKTQLALELVQRFPFDIISVDSAMVYRGMDIGTAKPTLAELQQAPHRLINIRDPKDSYSAAEFVKDATREIQAIAAAGRIPLLVGGTILYFRALQQGLAELPHANPDIRAALLSEAEESGWQALHQRLAIIDPEAAARIHAHDKQRIQRALEVYQMTGEKISALQKNTLTNSEEYIFHNMLLAPSDRQTLHHNIERRFMQMLEHGLIEEVQQLHARSDLSLDCPAMRSVGYHEVWQYLDGNIGFAQMVAKSIAASRQLAKRQLTFVKKIPGLVTWVADAPGLLQQVMVFLQSWIEQPK